MSTILRYRTGARCQVALRYGIQFYRTNLDGVKRSGRTSIHPKGYAVSLCYKFTRKFDRKSWQAYNRWAITRLVAYLINAGLAGVEVAA